MKRPLLVPLVTALGLLGWYGSGAAGSYRLVDDQGVVHFTNTPADPRFQRFPGGNGASEGWLSVPRGTEGRYAAEIQETAARHGVDPELVRTLIQVESDFNPWAVSPKGAQGLMQLMPRTAASLGVSNAFNPRQNIEGGVRHLRALIDRYRGDLQLALAAYNAGAPAVDSYRGIPPYPETQQYVRRVLSSYGVGPAAGDFPNGAGDRVGVLLPAPQQVYRYEDSEGTVLYTNVPPGSSRWLRR